MPEQESAEILPLVTGVIEDIHTLVKQEISLARSEIKNEVLNLKKSLVLIAISLICAVLGILMAGFTFIYLFAHFAPQVDLWVLFGFVTIVSLLLSSIFISKGLKNSRVIQSFIPNNQSK